MQDSSPAGAQKAASIQQLGIDDHVGGKRGSNEPLTESAFACSAHGEHRGILIAVLIPTGKWFHVAEMLTLKSSQPRSTTASRGHVRCDSLGECFQGTAPPL
jgi:hypothetical protein